MPGRRTHQGMAFLATDHPRSAGGRFVPAHHGEPGITLNSQFAPSAVLDLEQTEVILARRAEAARDVLEEYGDLEIMDHSPARRHTVELQELGDPRLALGNCWAATNELIEEAGAGAFGAEWVDEITIRRPRLGGHHVAVLAGDTEGLYVIDYTARQFHPDLPFPYVAGVKEWLDKITVTSGQKWEMDDEDD